MLTILKINSSNIRTNLNSKVCNPNGVVPVQQPGVDLLLSRFETTAGHVGISNGFNLQKTKLITKLIKCIIYLIKLIK